MKKKKKNLKLALRTTLGTFLTPQFFIVWKMALMLAANCEGDLPCRHLKATSKPLVLKKRRAVKPHTPGLVPMRAVLAMAPPTSHTDSGIGRALWDPWLHGNEVRPWYVYARPSVCKCANLLVSFFADKQETEIWFTFSNSHYVIKRFSTVNSN